MRNLQGYKGSYGFIRLLRGLCSSSSVVEALDLGR